MQRVAVLMVGWLAVGAVQAEMFKCTDAAGRVTFSQVQCAVDAEKVDVKTGGSTVVSTRKATDAEAQSCLDAIRHGYKDPSSLTIEGIVAFSTYGDGHTEVSMMVNARNSYGGYAGAKPAFCKYDADGAVASTSVF